MSENVDKAAIKKAQREAKKAEKEARKAKATMNVKKTETANNDNANENVNANANKEKKEIRLKREYANPTPKGEKKDTTGPMDKAYDPPAVEAAWYDWWEQQGFFKPDVSPEKEKFTIVIPPPNVTGSLHMGHALTNAIEDALTRWHRMSGRTALWVPGTDHAGIATQAVVEKRLRKERGISRHDLGREKFVDEVMNWKNEYQKRIGNQLRRLGSSCDWSREAFTMDDKFSRAVLECFCQFFDKGLVFRDNRLVHWSCALQSTISELEVDKIELAGKTKLSVPGYDKVIDFGELVHFAYRVDGSDELIIVATTRIETMIGDTAVAVHPDDPRYTHLHGKYVVHPFLDRKIPIITDGILVEKEFGTGAVKVTPSHDHNDYKCGIRNNLQFINILNDDGTFNENAGKYAGMRRYDVRYAIMKDLQELGLLRERVSNKMTLSICSRSGDVLEPLLKPQWWVNCDEMAKNALEAVTSGKLQIIPENPHTGTWKFYLTHLQPWCISRQLWWGHRIPAYRIIIDGVALADQNEHWVSGRSYEEALSKAQAKFPEVEPAKISLSQDEDVLDTWFSSGLFPIGVFGWPDQTEDFKTFYPTSVLETGYDILFFWVMRMVMMCHALTGEYPFSKVYLHSLVRDAQGRKMSKSLGNVIDPVDVVEGITLEELHSQLLVGNLSAKEIETAKANQKKDFPKGISECGTDATRFALCDFTQTGCDINLNINQVVVYRNFCNKLWNATILVKSKLGDDYHPPSSLYFSAAENENGGASFGIVGATLMEKWLLHKANKMTTICTNAWNTYEFSQATKAIFNFFMNEYCAVFLELSKNPLAQDPSSQEVIDQQTSIKHTMYYAFELGLRLLHPFMPFITEELWQRLPRREGDKPSIMISSYPLPFDYYSNPHVEEKFNFMNQLIHKVRSIRTSYNIPPKISLKTHFWCANDETASLLSEIGDYVVVLTNCTNCGLLSPSDNLPTQTAVIIISDVLRIYLSIEGVDIDKEIAKLKQLLEKTKNALAGLQKQISSPLYANTPDEKKEKDKQKEEDLKKEIIAIEDAIVGLSPQH